MKIQRSPSASGWKIANPMDLAGLTDEESCEFVHSVLCGCSEDYKHEDECEEDLSDKSGNDASVDTVKGVGTECSVINDVAEVDSHVN